MKISEMLEREDFYSINEKTLKDYYRNYGTRTSLYIYPQLNAIVTANPGRSVRNYLLTEYSVRSIIKRFLATCYVKMCLMSKGAMADKKITVDADLNNEILIYPCNKKYRIFDFERKTVSVIMKHGFASQDLQHEISYRKRLDNPDFVPGIISFSEKGYTEQIIDGKSIARISDKHEFESFKIRAYDEFRNYYKKYDSEIECIEYLRQLENEIILLLNIKKSNIPYTTYILDIVNNLKKLVSLDFIPLGFSHGDLQAGNIWIANNKIYIIDWESWGTRSIWYDYATLFNGLRPGSILGYLSNKCVTEEKAVVLLEDIIFQLKELNSLPENYGQASFNTYLKYIEQWLVVQNNKEC